MSICVCTVGLRKLVLPDDGAIEIPLPSSMKFYEHLGTFGTQAQREVYDSVVGQMREIHHMSNEKT